MRFVEIEGTIINIDEIQSVERSMYNSKYRCRINFSNGDYKSVDDIYYHKLKELVKPIHLSNENENINVDDFPGDNMVEE